MLQAIRDKVTGWIAYGIIFLISVPFALWGVNSYLGGGEAAPAATVNGEEITMTQLDRSYAGYRQRLAQLFGGKIPENFGSETQIKAQVLDQLIEEFALRQYTEERNYRLGDQELNRRIQGMQVFQRDGQFDVGIYQSQLTSQGYSPLSFEQELRRTQSMGQLRSGVIATAFMPTDLEKHFSDLFNQSRKIRSLTYSSDVAAIKVDLDEIEARYNAQTTRYYSPEMVKIDYIELSLPKLRSDMVVDQAQVRERYQNSLETYTSPESREASHILLKLDNDASDEASDMALEKINGLRQRIVNGESFADIAREYSQDPGSSSDGGKLGDIERGVMVQAFESALFSMQKDELSEPVKTSFGWHLIQLQAIKGGDVQPFDSVKADIENEIKTELAENKIFDLAENLANLVYEQPDSLLPAAEQMELQVETSDWFDRRSGSGIAAEAIVRERAFSQEVLHQGLNSEAIELGNDRVVFIRLNQLRAAAPRPLAEVSETIRAELVSLKAQQQSSEIGTQALAALNAGKSLDELAQEWSRPATDHGFVGRKQADIDPRLLATAFSMPRPDQGLVYQGLDRGNGEYSIIELSAVMSSDGNIDQQALDNLRNKASAAEYQALLKAITGRAEVVRFPLENL